ncbi:MAG TPA: MBL fold metallo-hydrolase [Candidatus Saccharimonadales bacterium]|nr:MBL fold metallo-hydrolase [Candidatus Saccharimonadales bacterium]
MKITKYEHACLNIEEQGRRLLIDPGTFTTSIPDFANIAAVVVTHVHQDHLDAEKLKAIHAANPEVQIYTVQTVADDLKDIVPVHVVTGGQKAGAGPFQLEFFGGEHALIHPSYPLTANVGVMVNKLLYYPGDSFAMPHQPVNTLAVPANAPWLKTSESMDFIVAIKPKRAFPTHNVFLSDLGNNLSNSLLENSAKTVGASYTFLEPRESISV